MEAPDVLVVGGGVNGLVCALVLARAGMAVQVLEDKAAVGGAHRTEYPFTKAPRLAALTGAHRLGFVPAELCRQLGVALPLAPRDPSLFVPTKTRGRFLLAGAGNDGVLEAVATGVSQAEARALGAMHEELDAIVRDLEPAWVAGPLSVEEIADRFVRAHKRDAFVALARGSLAAYVARFGLQSDLLKAALAVDALTGSCAGWDAPGSGAPLLVRHAARALAGGGDAVTVGGVGGLARALADAAQAAGVRIVTAASVRQIIVEGNAATGVVCGDGSTVHATTVVTSADPFRLRALVGADRFAPEYAKRLDALAVASPAAVARIQLALAELPRFACDPGERGQHRATTILLPGDEGGAVAALGRAFAGASAGQIPREAPIECVFPTATDDALRDAEGRHSASLLIPCAPYDLPGTTWAAEEERFVSGVLAALDGYAPGTSAATVDAVLFHPKKLESHFGVTHGHLGHIDETIVFGDRLPYATPVVGLYACGRACGPMGGMLGVAGLNAARRVLADLELGLETTELGYKE